MIPPDMPEPLGEPVQLNVFVDSDHAGDQLLPGDPEQELLSLSTKLLLFGIARNREVLKPPHLLVLSLWQ